jgi:hypothetical protein
MFLAPVTLSCSIRGLSSADLADVNGKLAEQVEANMGMAMIYALVSMAQDWLREKVGLLCHTQWAAHQ